MFKIIRLIFRIVNIASIQGLFGYAHFSTYVASKHACNDWLHKNNCSKMGELWNNMQCNLSQ
ncbi:SDR family NAD(P)-dependent oxidoreductase [Bacillus sp. 165]|nr:SDR family NAD(P)-dependent oxidoreductase [Bacillus sp. 165]